MARIKKTLASKAKPVSGKVKKNVNPVVSNEINGDDENGKLRCKSLVVDGTKYRTRLNKKFENRIPYVVHDPKKVTSQIPGSIVKIFVKEGQQVSKGETILVLEAMKMKNLILFPMDGEVLSIHVKEGERIPKGFLMLTLK